MTWLTEQEAAAELRMSAPQLRRARYAGKIKAFKCGHVVNYNMDEINAFRERSLWAGKQKDTSQKSAESSGTSTTATKMDDAECFRRARKILGTHTRF